MFAQCVHANSPRIWASDHRIENKLKLIIPRTHHKMHSFTAMGLISNTCRVTRTIKHVKKILGYKYVGSIPTSVDRHTTTHEYSACAFLNLTNSAGVHACFILDPTYDMCKKTHLQTSHTSSHTPGDLIVHTARMHIHKCTSPILSFQWLADDPAVHVYGFALFVQIHIFPTEVRRAMWSYHLCAYDKQHILVGSRSWSVYLSRNDSEIVPITVTTEIAKSQFLLHMQCTEQKQAKSTPQVKRIKQRKLFIYISVVGNYSWTQELIIWRA